MNTCYLAVPGKFLPAMASNFEPSKWLLSEMQFRLSLCYSNNPSPANTDEVSQVAVSLRLPHAAISMSTKVTSQHWLRHLTVVDL